MTVTTESADKLVLQFAASRPDDVATLLADGDPDELLALFLKLPHSTSAALAARLPSWQLSGLLARIEPDHLRAILLAAPADEAVALVAHLHESRYPSLLAASGGQEKRELQRLLAAPSHSVASLATTRFIRVEEQVTCGAFGEQLSRSNETRPRPIIVVDKLNRYKGMVDVLSVYAQKNRAIAVGEIARVIQPLNGVTDAKTALSAVLWLKFNELPVVDNKHRLLGMVSRTSLQRLAGKSPPMEFSLEKVLSEMATAYLATCSSLLEVLLGRSR